MGRANQPQGCVMIQRMSYRRRIIPMQVTQQCRQQGFQTISKVTFLLLVCLFALSLLGMDVSPNYSKATKTTKSKGGSAYDVIAAVNQVRAANGLSAYQINAALMSSAQGHSEYQASIGSITHTGRGGSDAKSRAIAAGYGGGTAVSVTENIYGGANATPQQAVSWWKGDSLHLNTMLSSKAVDAGAGVATDGSVVYYTLDVGYVVGSEGSGSGSGSGSISAAGNSAAPATAVAFYPVQVSTPNPDGSVVHLVQAGQTLWSIAATYKVSLPALLKLNGFTNSTFIYPGQKIAIKSPGTPPSTTTSQAGSPVAATATQELTDTPILAPATEAAMPELNETERFSEAPVSSSTSTPRSGIDPLLLVIAVFVLGGTVLILVGNILQRSK